MLNLAYVIDQVYRNLVRPDIESDSDTASLLDDIINEIGQMTQMVATEFSNEWQPSPSKIKQLIKTLKGE